MIFQDDCLFPHLNVAANIRFGLKGWRRDQADARLAEVAALCGVEHLLERRPETLSGGERQRVGLARRWRRAPGSCSAMSRSPPSTWRTATRSSNAFARSSVPRRSRCSTSLTVRPRPSRWARDCSCWRTAESSPRDRRWTCSVRLEARRCGSIAWEGVRNVFPARDRGPLAGARSDPP